MYLGPIQRHPARHSLPAVVTTGVVGAALVLAFAGAAGAATYYVDNQSATCGASGPGTEAFPYCTITAAAAAHNFPGDAIVVKAGIYREQVTIPGSGLAGLPYVIRAQGPGVVVDGANDFSNTALWAPATGTEFLAATVGTAPLQVLVDGARLAPSVELPGALPSGSFAFVSGTGLYVNLGGDNPGTHQTLVGQRLHGFNIFGKSFVVIDGFEITRQQSRGVNIQNGCADLVISNNRVSFTDSYGIQTVNGQRIVIDGNVVSDGNFHGIGLTAGASGCTVSNNESFRNVDPDVRRANGIHLFGAPGNTLFGNRVHDNQDTGLHFAGGSNDCVSFNNGSWNNGDHGFDHLASSGVYHTNEVAFGNYKDGFSFEGGSPGGSLYNSVSVDNGITTGENDLWVDLASSVGFSSDRNIFWNSTPQPPIRFIATTYALLSDYQLATGLDANSIQADSKFENGTAGDFHLSAKSPAIDAAYSGVLHWPATDAEGTARIDDLLTPDTGSGSVTYADIGALEYVPRDKRPTVSAPNRVKVGPGDLVTFAVTASDPDGDPITSLFMIEDPLMVGGGATFNVDPTNTSGTFTWATRSYVGNYHVRFVALNSLGDTTQTVIQIKKKGRHSASEVAPVTELALSGGFPNPSPGAVEFALDLPREAGVRWAVFDLQGRMVWSESQMFSAGRRTLRWDGTMAGGGTAPTGVYLVKAWVEGTQYTRRVVRL